MNKRAEGEEIMYFGFFFVLMMVILGIVVSVAAFHSKSYDFRRVEAELLAGLVIPCFMENDFFSAGFEEEFFETCGINEDVFSQHLVLVRGFEGEKEFSVGVRDFMNQCDLSGSDSNLDLPQCEKLILMKDGEDFELIVGARQVSRRSA